ncbi:MAG: 1,4-alpha-glucan-branching enzyme, partial [Planctomycetes bacterium]|nr:1,4-alpha-glucan-branching enzyme [Planctomycetota bacterium]
MNTPQILQLDPWLESHSDAIHQRIDYYRQRKQHLIGSQTLNQFANGHAYYGLHACNDFWTFRESLPNANAVFILCQKNNWQCHDSFRLKCINDHGDWQLSVALEIFTVGDHYRLHVQWDGGNGERIPAYAQQVTQNEDHSFNAVIHRATSYQWQYDHENVLSASPLIYECHIGMAQEAEEVGSFADFEKHILPRIIAAGYNAVQFMALMEHPYYGSFGYQVSSFFALSSRFGPADDFRSLVDTCHKHGIAVIMDLIHSHAVKNEVEGLSKQDGTAYQYFHDGDRGQHPAWDSRCFDYGKDSVVHFLLSNCKYWLEEFHLDGFRFDGVTSMLYTHHGLGTDFDNYDKYYYHGIDADAICYLTMANELIHNIKPSAICIAEDMSGMPGTCLAAEDGGLGFDYRLAMGTPDMWAKLIDDCPDEQWSISDIFNQLRSRRSDCKTIAYAESHDQALVGDKCISFRLMDKDMYSSMQRNDENIIIDRGMALHKLTRLITLCAGGEAYLNFMGNEFGHPEWIDFPREGNNWSYAFARRQWHLRDDPKLRYGA